jgi:hypothetical protein
VNAEHSSIASHGSQEVPLSWAVKYDDRNGLAAHVTPRALGSLKVVLTRIWTKMWPFIAGFAAGAMTG